jgi:hypothetical protein
LSLDSRAWHDLGPYQEVHPQYSISYTANVSAILPIDCTAKSARERLARIKSHFNIEIVKKHRDKVTGKVKVVPWPTSGV